MWPQVRLDTGPIEERLKSFYRGEGRAPTMHKRLRNAAADVYALLREMEFRAAAIDGFLEAIGNGVLTVKKTPTARRALRELAAKAKARREMKR